MLNRLGLTAQEANIKQALFKVFEEGKYTTRDVGGQGNMTDFVKAVINNLK